MTTRHQSLDDNKPATAIEYPTAIQARTHLGPLNPTGFASSPSAAQRMTRVTTPTTNPRRNPPGPAQNSVSPGNDPKSSVGEIAAELGREYRHGTNTASKHATEPVILDEVPANSSGQQHNGQVVKPTGVLSKTCPALQIPNVPIMRSRKQKRTVMDLNFRNGGYGTLSAGCRQAGRHENRGHVTPLGHCKQPGSQLFSSSFGTPRVINALPPNTSTASKRSVDEGADLHSMVPTYQRPRGDKLCVVQTAMVQEALRDVVTVTRRWTATFAVVRNRRILIVCRNGCRCGLNALTYSIVRK